MPLSGRFELCRSWYEGNADKMEGALHPHLAKRIARTNDKGQSNLGQMTAMELVQGTRSGLANRRLRRAAKGRTILDMLGNAATVKLEMRDWVDYMTLRNTTASGDRKRALGIKAEKEEKKINIMTLTKLPIGTKAKVVSISGEKRVTRRLMEMGIVPGVPIKILKTAPFGDPLKFGTRL